MRDTLIEMPVSLAWFVLTGALFALQVVPQTGVFLMFLLAPYWSIVTVNLGFVSLVGEALFGRVNKAWLLAPALWFGGYAVAATVSHIQFNVLDASFRKQNEGKSVQFSAADTAIVFESKSSSSSGAASHFVRSYDVPVAYEENPNFITARHLAYRIGDRSRCDSIRKDDRYRSSGVNAFGFHENKRFVTNLCVVSGPEDPAGDVVLISEKVERQPHSELLPFDQHTITITQPGGATTELVSGSAAPLQWLPMPVMGCALISSSPAWRCTAGFARESLQGLGAPGAYGSAALALVAKTLGLRESPASERLASFAGRQAAPNLEPIIEQRLRVTLGVLDRVIADPGAASTIHDYAGLHQRPDLISRRAPEIVTAIVAALDIGHSKSLETGRNLQALLAVLPFAEFEPHARVVLGSLEARSKMTEYMIDHRFLARLGELGGTSLSFLERVAFELRGPKGQSLRTYTLPAIEGLCKAGRDAAHLAERIAVVMNASGRRTDGLYTTAFVALLRLGRPDLADIGPDKASPYRAREYQTWRRTITSDSPSSACRV